MPKKIGDKAHNTPPSIGEIVSGLADSIQKKDIRYNRFWNYKPVPKLMDDGSGEGFYSTKRKVKSAFGANRSTKTTGCCYEAIMLFTGIIPPAMQGHYAWEEKLRALTHGPNRRARYVRIVVMDYGKHWNTAIRPMLMDSTNQGMLPEAWSNYDPVHHQFTGPDGSILDIFSADPTQDVDPMKLRGGRIDHTWIDEINREPIYTESAARPAASPESPGTVSLSYCPQNGFDWTYETFYKACYNRRGQVNTRKSLEEQNPSIYSVHMSMKDNPSITAESYAFQKTLYRDWEIAFRVDGWYSERTSDAFFHPEHLIAWDDNERCSKGTPVRVKELEVNPETGTFKGAMGALDHNDIMAGGVFDAKYNPVWWIWEIPQEGEKYIMSADIGEGNPESDPHSVSIWKCTDQSLPVQVAHLHMRLIKPGNLAVQACCMANAWGDCILVPEANNTGGGMFLDRARRYRNLYHRIKAEEQEDKFTEKLGWFTSKHTKGPMLDNAYKMIMEMGAIKLPGPINKNGEPTFINHCPFNDQSSLSECISYEEKLDRNEKTGITKITWGASKSNHDDCTMEMAIAWKVIKDEYSKISACKIFKSLIPIKKDEHYLGETPAGSRKSFKSWKKQTSMKELQKRRGITSGNRRTNR